MSKSELAAYYKHLDNVVVLRDNIVTARGEGRLEGRAEGLAEGRAEGEEKGRSDEKRKIAKSLKNAGTSIPLIIQVTGLSGGEIAGL